MFKKIILLTILTLFTSELFAADYYRFLYTTEGGESFASVLKKFVKDGSYINSQTPLVQKTLKANPQVKNWNKIDKNINLEIFISNDMMDMDKYKRYEERTTKVVAEKASTQKAIYPSGLKGSVFYMASSGSFTQSAPDVAEINFKQNSPFSLGTAFTFYPKDKLYSFSFSTYYSHLVASGNTLTADTISIPAEIGASAYGEYRYEKWNMTFYTGPDYEKFSVFNMRGLQNEQKIYVDSVGVIYLTAGLAKSFEMFNQKFFTKLSVSQSISSTYKNNAPVSVKQSTDFLDEGSYSGSRLLFYLNYKVTNKFYLHTLLKYHTMTGPSTLTTLRAGFGVGYILF